jgi:cystathionine gamma-lyase
MVVPDGAGDGTRSVHAGVPAAVPGQPLLPGPVLAAPFHLDPAGFRPGSDGYGRPGNPTVRLLEEAIGSLEGGDCVAFASGMAAISALLMSRTRPGDTVLLPSDGYWETRFLADFGLAERGVTVRYAPTATVLDEDLTGVALVLAETPANPGLDVCDIRALATAVHAAGGLLAVDNTTATPLGQQPLALGADLVVASGTKALSGHSDLLLGYTAAADLELSSLLRAWRNSTGGVPGAFEAWLAHRSMGTLDLRLARQTENAAAVATLLSTRPEVTGLRWPGRPQDPSYPVAGRQMRRIPGVVTFVLPSADQVARFLRASTLVAAATSFGGLHTTADRRAQWGGDAVPDGLVRLSCGCEDSADLLRDLTAALDAAAAGLDDIE